jgi:hypothetical protein
MSEMDYPEEFAPIAAGLKRLPTFSPSARFADKVIAGVTRLHASEAIETVRPTPTSHSRLEVIRGGAVRHVPDSALVKARRRRMLKVAVAVPVSIGTLIAVSVLFAQLDLVAILLSTAIGEMSVGAAAVAVSAGSFVIGDAAVASLEAGTAQAALLYLVIAVGLLAGYGGIKTAAEIARRKAA